MPISELAKLINKTESTVAQYASRRGLSISFYGHGSCKETSISDSTVDEIKRLLKETSLPCRLIAERTGVKTSYVLSIKCGRIRNKKKTTKDVKADTSLINQVFN